MNERKIEILNEISELQLQIDILKEELKNYEPVEEVIDFDEMISGYIAQYCEFFNNVKKDKLDQIQKKRQIIIDEYNYNDSLLNEAQIQLQKNQLKLDEIEKISEKNIAIKALEESLEPNLYKALDDCYSTFKYNMSEIDKLKHVLFNNLMISKNCKIISKELKTAMSQVTSYVIDNSDKLYNYASDMITKSRKIYKKYQLDIIDYKKQKQENSELISNIKSEIRSINFDQINRKLDQIAGMQNKCNEEYNYLENELDKKYQESYDNITVFFNSVIANNSLDEIIDEMNLCLEQNKRELLLIDTPEKIEERNKQRIAQLEKIVEHVANLTQQNKLLEAECEKSASVYSNLKYTVKELEQAKNDLILKIEQNPKYSRIDEKCKELEQKKNELNKEIENLKLTQNKLVEERYYVVTNPSGYERLRMIDSELAILNEKIQDVKYNRSFHEDKVLMIREDPDNIEGLNVIYELESIKQQIPLFIEKIEKLSQIIDKKTFEMHEIDEEIKSHSADILEYEKLIQKY